MERVQPRTRWVPGIEGPGIKVSTGRELMQRISPCWADRSLSLIPMGPEKPRYSGQDHRC